MRQFNYFCSIVLTVLLPLMIVILSSNLILRSSATYTFHFNDSQVVTEVPYNVKGNEFAEAIADYWSSFSTEPFQVYEDNGMFKDEIFEEDEQAVENTGLFQMRARIAEMLSGLPEQDQKLLTLRFGLEGGKPLSPEDTGIRLDLTPEEVVAREAAALAQLRKA